MSIQNNFCVIDIGTNAIKCKLFSNGKYITLRNKFLSSSGFDNLDKDEVLKYLQEFMEEASNNNISRSKVYICATEGFRTSTNQQEINDTVFQETGRRIHIISPKREAYLSVIGGLQEIPADKLTAKNVLYIESGGGSTEISLADLSSRPPSIVATVSLPFGTKRYDTKDENAIYYQAVKDFLKQIQKSSFIIDDSIACVINSTAAARVISAEYTPPRFNPKITMLKQQKMSVPRFVAKLREIIVHKENIPSEKYWLNEQDQNGFIGHCHILNKLFFELKKQRFPANLNSVRVSTTIGGVKDGLGFLLENSLDNIEDDLRNFVLEITERGSHSFIEKKNTEVCRGWLKQYQDFYENRTHRYLCKTENEHLEVKDENDNHIIYETSHKVSVKCNKTSTGNKIYEDLILNAKNSGHKAVRFSDEVSLDLKLRIYSACIKHGLEMQNFQFDEKMLEQVSPSTQKIVKNALNGTELQNIIVNQCRNRSGL